MSADLQLDRLIVLSQECLDLLSQDRIEDYLSLESERRHLLDHLPTDLSPDLRPRLEQLQAITEALSAEVSRSLAELKPKLKSAQPRETGSGYSSWA